MSGVCSVEGCGRKMYGNTFCNAHNQQYRKHGRIISATLKNKNGGNTCKIDGCESPSRALGYCLRHYDQVKDHGGILGVERMRAVPIGVGMMKQKGYIYLLRKDHPHANKDGYVKRANIVWEENTGHMVTSPEMIHHKNEIKADDEFENLELCKNKKDHGRIHSTGKQFGRVIKKEVMVCAL